MQRARRENDVLIISIFVNPTVRKQLACTWTESQPHKHFMSPLTHKHTSVYTYTRTHTHAQQFGPNEDFSKYPRQLEKDVELAKGAGKNIKQNDEMKCLHENYTHTCTHTTTLPSFLFNRGRLYFCANTGRDVHSLAPLLCGS